MRTSICRHCGNDYSRRLRTRLVEKMFLRLFRLAPFRCGSCEKRFYARVKIRPVGARSLSVPAQTNLKRRLT